MNDAPRSPDAHRSPDGPTPALGAPPVGTVLGTMTFGDTVDLDGSREILHAALDAGVRWIDTANAYSQGECERILARILPADRSDLVLATKVGMPHTDAGDRPALSRDAIIACVEASLSRLQTDRVDLLYLHKPDPLTPLDETLETVAELVRQGKVGRLATSNYAAWQLERMIGLAPAELGLNPLIAQQVYSPVARRLEDEYAAFARDRGAMTLVYNPLAGGLLTGRHSFSESPTAGRFASPRLGDMYRDRYWDESVFAAVDALAGVADAAGLSLAELSLRWTLSSDVVDGVLIGGSKVEHIRQNIAALAAGPLDDDLIEAVAAATDTLRGRMPAYNR